MGDTISGLHAGLGILMALRAKDRGDGGQVVDVALYESMFNLLEAVVPEYDGANLVREPSGTTVTGIVPTNTYKCADNKYLVIGGNGDSIFARLMTAVGRDDMATDSKYSSNARRVEHEAEIDRVLSDWCQPAAGWGHGYPEQHRTCGPVYSVADMMSDSHFQQRGLFEQVEINGQPLKIPVIMPRLENSPVDRG